METKNQVEDNDILSDIRELETRKRKALLAKKIVDLKKVAKRINELKAETELLFEELHLTKEDSKRVIDFVNELDEVKLTASEREAIRSRMKKGLQEDKESIEAQNTFSGQLKSAKKTQIERLSAENAGYSNFTGGLNVGSNVSWLSTTANSKQALGGYLASSAGTAGINSFVNTIKV